MIFISEILQLDLTSTEISGNFHVTSTRAYQLAQKLKNASKFENALHILELCYERIPPDPVSHVIIYL